jgi:PAS domain S-box-containing protein
MLDVSGQPSVMLTPSAPVTATALASRAARWAWLPVPVLLVAMVALWAADMRTSYGSPALVTTLNFTFATLASLAVAFLIGRSFRAQPEPGMLLVGCGMLVWGVGSLVAAAVAGGVTNILITVHNLAVWLGACGLLGGVLLPRRRTRAATVPGLWLAGAYAISLGVVALIALAALAGRTPFFFVQGQGGTVTRQFVLASAIAMLFLTAARLRPAKGGAWSDFAYWYALALLLLALGLCGVLVQKVSGSLLGWMGRVAQYLGGAYMLVAALAWARQAGVPVLALETQRDWVWYRYAVAVTMVVTATTVRLAFLQSLGLRATFITFYPAVILAALAGGLGPGLLATLLSAFLANYFWMEPVGSFAVIDFADWLSLGIFCTSGALISFVTEAMHRARARAAVAEEAARHATERERAERALLEARREKEFLADVLEHAAQPFAVGYPDGRIGLINRAYEELTGYTAEELRAIDWVTVLTPPEWRELERRSLEELHRTGQPVRYEKEYLRKDGTRVPIELLVHLARDAQGKPEYYYSFLTDITERKRAEEELRKSEERLTFALETSHTGAWELDLRDHSAHRSLEHDRIFGYTELLPQWTYEMFLEHVLPEDRPAVDSKFRHAVETGTDWGFECRIRRADQQVRWIWAAGRHRTDAAGVRRGMTGIVQDITERKRAEEALLESERQFRTLADSIPNLAWWANSDGYITWYNRRWYDYTGTTPAQMEGWGWQTVHDPQTLPAVLERWKASLSAGQPFEMTFPLRGADGVFRPFLTRGIPLKDAQGRVQQWFGTNTDVAEAQRAEQAMRDLNAQLQQRVAELQAANAEIQASRRAAMNLMEDALQARKQAEEANAALRSLSEQRRLALEAADLGTWDYRFQAGEVFWDERCRQMWGMVEAEQVDYSTAISRIHPEDRTAVDVAVQEALAGRSGGGYHSEFRVVWPDGSIRWIASHGRVYFEGEGAARHAVRFIGANLDITAERQAMEALRESQERLAAFAAASFEGIVLSDRGRILDCNEQLGQMLGFTVQEIKGRAMEEFVAPEDRARVLENIRAGRESVIEHQILRRDGLRITVEAHGRPHPDHRGLRHTAIRDITERKQREELLERLNRTLKALKDSSQAMMRATTEEQYLKEVCRILLEDCGHAMVWIGFAEHDQAKSIRPLAWSGFEEGYLETLNLTWADTDRGRGPTGTAIRTGHPAACKNVHTDPQFAPWRAEAIKRGYASSLVVPLLEEGTAASPRRLGPAFGAITIYSRLPNAFTEDEVNLLLQLADDVAYCIRVLRLREARAQAERRTELLAADLKRSNRDLEQFAYVASHDLQEPLRAVGGYVKLLERRLGKSLDAKGQEYVAGAFEGALRMERLIHDLLDFSRVGTRGGKFVPTDLEVPLDHALGNLQASLKSVGAGVTYDPLPTLAVDATQLMQVFQNLIGNAVKFRGERAPQIHVGAEQKDGRWVFSVRDNGIGIEPQYYERIFQLFQRLHTRKEYPGTGIGLAICKRIIERHGGTIWVESQPGRGSTFYFSIPASTAAA